MYIISTVCKQTGEGNVSICSEKELNVVGYDIPKKINSSKTITRYDDFAGLLWITTITKIDKC